MTVAHARDLDALLRYYARELTGDEELTMEDHWAGCPDCADTAADVATLIAGVTDLVSRGFGLWAISPSLLSAFRARGLRILEAGAAPGDGLALKDTRDIDLLIARLRGDFSGRREVDVVFDTIGGQIWERSVPVHSDGEVIIACVLHLREPAGTQIRSTCTVKADDIVLGEYHLAIDVS